MVLERREPPYLGDERSTLVGFLDYQRATLALKCEGLSDDQLRLASSPPSTLSLLGLVRHMAEVERGWMRRTVGGEDVGLVYSSGDDYEAAYDATGADPTACFAAWQAEITAGRGYADALSLDHVGVRPESGTEFSLRCVLTHLIEEYARHNGHADFLREAIDGSTGE